MGLSIGTAGAYFYLLPPTAAPFLVPTSLYICLLLLKRTNAANAKPANVRGASFLRFVRATVFGVFYLISLPVGFWFGGGLGGFIGQQLGRILSIGDITIFFIFYSTMFVSILFISMIGIFIGWLIGIFIDWLIGRVLGGLFRT